MRSLPALKVLFALCTGIIVTFWAKPDITLVLLVLAPVLLCAAILNSRTAGQPFLYLGLMLCGALSFVTFSQNKQLLPERIEATGIICEQPFTSSDYTSFALKTRSIATNKTINGDFGKLRISSNKPVKNLEAGMLVRVSGIFTPSEPPANPGEFNFKNWSDRNGYLGNVKIFRSADIQVLSENHSPLNSLKNRINKAIDKYAGKNSGLVKALLLGYRRELDENLTEELRRTGLSHLLALSGLHVGFIVGILIGIGALLRLTPARRSGLAILGIILFALIVPDRSSTIRASLMAVIFLSGPIFRRWSPPLNTLAVAALIILVFRPGELFDTGFQLSFAAVGGILIFHSICMAIKASAFLSKNRKRRLLNIYLVQPLLISISATIFVLPLTSHYFGKMALGGPIYNLIAIPALWLVFAYSWLVVGTSFIWTGAASFLSGGLKVVCYVWRWLAHYLSQSAPEWDTRLAPLTIFFICAFLIWFAYSRKKLIYRTLVSILSLSLLLSLDSIKPTLNGFHIWFLSVGNGDAQVWRLPDEKTVVIDGGKWQKKNNNTLLNFLKYTGARKIDLIVATHPDADHIGGLIDVIREIPVELAVTSMVSTETNTFERLLKASSAKNINWTKVTAGSYIKKMAPGYRIEFAGPPGIAANWSTNEASVVMLLTVWQNSDTLRLLTTGDAERNGERAIIDYYKGSIDLLKAGHHGSHSSSTPEFVDSVRPKIAVISRAAPVLSLAEDSAYEVILRLQDAGAKVHHTGIEGALLFKPSFSNSYSEWKRVDWRNPPFYKWLLGVI